MGSSAPAPLGGGSTALRSLSVFAALLAFDACSVRPAPSSGTIDISVAYQVDTLDPHVWNYLGNFALASHFYEALVTTDAEMRIHPCLAVRWENPDPDTWIFHLRPGVKFHRGRGFTSRDVVFTINRLLTEPDLEMSGWVVPIREVAAVDDLTVRIRTNHPLAVLLNKLRFVHIIPADADPARLRESPDGTGPYKLVRWSRGVSVRVVRNSLYWDGPPSIGLATFHLGQTPEQAANALISGSSQLAQYDSKAIAAELARVRGLVVLRHMSLRVEYLGYDLSRDASPYVSEPSNPFRNLLVRRALSLAIDRNRLAESLTTNAIPATQFVPSSVFGYNPDIPVPLYDPARARALLEEAGFPHGFSVTLHSRAPFRESAATIKEHLKAVGIDVEVRELSQTDFFDHIRKRDLSMYIARFGSITGDAGDVLEIGFHTWDVTGRMGFHNYGGYSNATLDRQIEESASIAPMTVRGQELGRLMAAVVDELPWLPLSVVEDIYGIAPRYSWTPRHDGFILASEIDQN